MRRVSLVRCTTKSIRNVCQWPISGAWGRKVWPGQAWMGLALSCSFWRLMLCPASLLFPVPVNSILFLIFFSLNMGKGGEAGLQSDFQPVFLSISSVLTQFFLGIKAGDNSFKWQLSSRWLQKTVAFPSSCRDTAWATGFPTSPNQDIFFLSLYD